MEKLIGMPLDKARAKLEKEGFKVEVVKCSLPKIKTDSELVVSYRLYQNIVTLFVGDFLIEVG